MTIERDDGTRLRERQFKQVDVDGEEGGADLTLLVSTDAMDDEGDVVEQSWEFDDTIQFLWSHKSREFPLGHITNPRVVDVARLDAQVSEGAEKGLVVDVDVDDAEDPRAALALHKFQRGDLDDSSVGFDPLEFDTFGDDEPGRFHFQRNKLREVSATNVGANPDVTTLRKSLGEIDEETEKLLREIADKQGDDASEGDTSDQTKEGRRNRELDEAALRHAKELIEHNLGERDADDVGDCPLCKGGMDDDKSGGPCVQISVDADDIGDVVEQKVAEVLEGQDDDTDQTKGDEGQDDADEPEGDGLRIEDGTIVEFSQETSGQSDSSSGDGDAETPETVDELFAQ